MIYRISYFFLLLSSLIIVQGCETLIFERGNGDVVIRTVAVDHFDEIFLNGNYEVFLEEGETPEVVIKTDENLHDFIIVESRSNTLGISNERRIKGSDGIKIFITYQELEKLNCAGASSVFTTSPVSEDDLELSMSGAGVMDMEVVVNDLEVSLSGAGLIRLEGEASRQDISLTGAGSLEAFDLISKDCEISISGVGGAEIFVTGKLTARVSGVGGIKFKGSPEEIRREVSGIGKIKVAD